MNLQVNLLRLPTDAVIDSIASSWTVKLPAFSNNSIIYDKPSRLHREPPFYFNTTVRPNIQFSSCTSSIQGLLPPHGSLYGNWMKSINHYTNYHTENDLLLSIHRTNPHRGELANCVVIQLKPIVCSSPGMVTSCWGGYGYPICNPPNLWIHSTYQSP